ncbi:MAG: VanZ family protein [Sphingobacteriales bacterium]|nr:VanZ family protein [Sphingobacteriales bacterium]
MKKINPSPIPAIIWFIVTHVLLTLPGSAFPKENWLDKIYADKLIHTGLFAILSILCCWAILKRNISTDKLKIIFIRIGLICLAYGIGMEFVQKYWVANRSFDPGDIVADGVGSGIGVLFSFKRYIKK